MGLGATSFQNPLPTLYGNLDMIEIDFDVVLGWLQYFDKRRLMTKFYVVAVCKNRPQKCQKMTASSPSNFKRRTYRTGNLPMNMHFDASLKG